ncbi:MAG: HupE/UreJ family protein [Beijerinckiaceae bacterium]
MATSAWGHTGHGNDWQVGFTHPLTGPDHMLAMLAVGLWAAIRGGSAAWLWPTSFVAAMLCGFGLAQTNIVIPMLEFMIASSLILLGGGIAFRLSAPVIWGAAVIALAGAAHGFAHGLEIQGSPLPFAVSFSLSTSLLHVAGLVIGYTAERITSAWMTRSIGVGIAAAGLVIMS